MSQHRFHFIRCGFARVAEIDLVMLSSDWTDAVLQSILCHELLHAGDGGRLSGIWPNVHGLYAQTFLKESQFYLIEHFAVAFFLANLLTRFLEYFFCNDIRLHDH